VSDEDKALLLDIIVESDSPGIIIDEAKARASNCKCLDDKPPHFCFVPGIIGTLKGEQAKDICKDKRVELLADGRRARFQKFSDAAQVCNAEVASLPRGERLHPRLQCMSRELKKKGVEI
jgi:hypothetical protein